MSDYSCNRKRRALVLAGGGAKGAYAFGCLRAFKERGLYFDAVAGTSVGALNAIVWSTDQFERGERLWRELSFDTIYPYALLNARRFNPTVKRVVAYAFVSLRLLMAVFQGKPIPGRSVIVAIATALAMIPWLFFLSIPTHVGGWPLLIFAVTVAWIGFGLWSSLSSGRLTIVIWLAAAAVPLWLLFPINGAVGLVGYAQPYLVKLIGQDATAGVGGALAAVMSGGCMLFLFWGLKTIVELTETIKHWEERTTVLTSGPLKAHVDEILTANLRTRTIVTMATLQRVFDPDDPKWYSDPPDPDGQLVGRRWPNTRTVWTPIYQNLGDLDVSTATRACMASAALPFGIVPSIAVCGRTCVDGGVADNTPVFPFMNDDSIDEIYVVLLEPVQHLKDVRALIGATREAWSRRDRDLRVAAFEHPSPIWKDEPRPYRVREQPPKHIPLRPLNHLPEIKVFSPERSLGSTLSGTLNFDGKYAERLIERGLRETEAALDRITAKESLR